MTVTVTVTLTARTRFVVAALAAIAVDLATKSAAVAALGGSTVDLRVIDLRVVRNDGVAFGAGSFVPAALLVFLTFAVTAILTVAVWKELLPAGVPSGLVVGGALANVMDRAVGGTVIDMLDIGWWPAFNVADVCIVVGVAGLLFQGFRDNGGIVQEPA